MAEPRRKEELERRLAQARRLLKDAYDPTTKERLKRFTADLEAEQEQQAVVRVRRTRQVTKPPVGDAMATPTVEQIRQRAQEIWIENHRPEGRDDEFWYQAEKELNEKELGDIAKEPPPTILPG
jgi:hypothetical protein